MPLEATASERRTGTGGKRARWMESGNIGGSSPTPRNRAASPCLGAFQAVRQPGSISFRAVRTAPPTRHRRNQTPVGERIIVVLLKRSRAGAQSGGAGTKRRLRTWDRRVRTDAGVPPAFVIPAQAGSMRSQGSGVTESEADRWTILRRFVETSWVRDTGRHRSEGWERFDNLYLRKIIKSVLSGKI